MIPRRRRTSPRSASPIHPALAALALAGCAREPEPAPAPAPEDAPNVLWITIDTLRARDLEPYGYGRPTSPELARIAREGVVVEHAFAQAPWTKPSVASMFTSLRPHVHGADSESTGSRLAPPLVTFAEILEAGGYRTAGFSENPHIQPFTAFDQGFDEFPAREDWTSATGATLDAALGWIAASDGERPFFCYVQILDPHGPYQPPPPLDAEFTSGLEAADPDALRGDIDAFQKDGEMVKPLAEGEHEYVKALYDAEVRSVDDALAPLFGRLRADGRLDETLVVVTSDHGEEFAEHGGYLHGYHLYDEALHVPLLLRGPGIARGRVDDVLVEHIDLAPTLLDLLGLPAPEAWQGTSFAARLRGSAGGLDPELEEVLCETRFRERDLRALRTREWKLVHDELAGTYHLYDLTRDPGERTDVVDRHPDVAARLKARLEALVARAPEVDLSGAHGEPDAALQAALRAIGYADGDAADGGE